MEKLIIPPKERDEWKKMITEEITHRYQNFVLQMKLTQTRKDISDSKITMNEALESIYKLCSKYAVAVQPDVTQIFKTW